AVHVDRNRRVRVRDRATDAFDDRVLLDHAARGAVRSRALEETGRAEEADVVVAAAAHDDAAVANEALDRRRRLLRDLGAVPALLELGDDDDSHLAERLREVGRRRPREFDRADLRALLDDVERVQILTVRIAPRLDDEDLVGKRVERPVTKHDARDVAPGKEELSIGRADGERAQVDLALDGEAPRRD